MIFDHQFWKENGYIVIKQAVPQENLPPIIAAMKTYMGRNLDNPSEWYGNLQGFGGGGMVNMAHHQSLWDNRQHPQVHQAFAEIWETEKLWVTYNRVNFNPPANEHWGHSGFIHWDLDTTYFAQNPDTEACVQGVLCLTDTAENMGGFQCVPGTHRRLTDWLKNHGPDQPPTVETIQGDLPIKRIAAQAGDLILWTQALLHGNGKNQATKPRLAQYICMTPEGTARSPRGLNDGGDELRQARFDTWRYGDYQRLVANALSVPEGLTEQWMRHLISETRPNLLPQIDRDTSLSETQKADLLALIAEKQPWAAPEIVHAEAMQKKYGTPASYLPRAVMAKQISTYMFEAFGIPFEARPAQLSELGRRLLGAERWD